MKEPKSSDQLKLADADVTGFQQSLGDERLLTREQAAAFLNVGVRTVEGWCANFRARRRRPRRPDDGRTGRERLSFVKLGGRVFFMLGDLRAFRDSRKVAA